MKFINVMQNKTVYADGIHDDTKALQRCIDEVKDGGTVYFPDGIYLVSASLIFYSNQTFKLSDKAVILRSDKSEPLTRYLLASYSEPDWTEYNGTHDVVISGGVFDGNANLTEKTTLLNTVHCRNITIENCRFINCAHWHCIEINGTENAIVKNCIFEGSTYTAINDELLNEQLQLDLARDGSYGPVYNCDGKLIDFCNDDTVCRNITIRSNIFKCAGFPGIGHHGDCGHHNIEIVDNIFDGPSGNNDKSRGYIIFRPMVYDVKIKGNAFISSEKTENLNIGIIIENSDENALVVDNNIFVGNITEEIVRGGIVKHYVERC